MKQIPTKFISEAEYPREVSKNLRYRANLLSEAQKDSKLRAVLKEKCRRDRLYLFNVFYWTYDPRPANKIIPFITYPFQDHAILWDLHCLIKGEDNFIDKSRDMGATWMLVGNDLAEWLFAEERIEIRWGSRKEQYVDTPGDMDAIFPKFRFLLKNMPKWLLPEGFNWHAHDNNMRLINPETGSSITGESTNEEFGRGGRKLRVRFDEFAFWDMAKAAWGGTADVTNCRTAVSTPHGSGNKFAKLAKGNEIKNKISLHWTLHPRKVKGSYYYNESEKIPIKEEEAYNIWLQKKVKVRSPWYDAEEARRSKRDVAQEIDIDYLMSGNPFFDPAKLQTQRAWEEYARTSPLEGIPYGKYIKANLVEVRGKVEIKERPEGWCNIFELPNKSAEYVIGEDTAEGLPTGDRCFAVVRNKWDRNVVATIRLQCKPEEFAPKCHLLGKLYNDALHATENNNHGYSVAKELEDLGANMHYSKTSKGAAPKRGFTTTPKTRPLMLDRLEEEIRKCAIEIRDPEILTECEVFVHNEKNGKPEADGDFNDDGVLATAIAGLVIDIEPYKGKRDDDFKRRAMVEDLKRRRKNSFSFKK